MKDIFVTGTDTGIGKTVVTGLFAGFLAEKGVKVVTQKWIQTGCFEVSEDIEEHLRLMGAKDGEFERFMSDMSPYIFDFAASPHLAAGLENKMIEPELIMESYRRLCENFEVVLAEGAGGFLVPYDDEKYMSDVAGELGLEVLIVAKNKLGVINHTMLTVEAIRARGLDIAGIVFNEESGSDETIAADNLKIIDKLTGGLVVGELVESSDVKELKKSFEPLGEKLLEKMRG